jgi:hypothetical protein
VLSLTPDALERAPFELDAAGLVMSPEGVGHIVDLSLRGTCERDTEESG